MNDSLNEQNIITVVGAQWGDEGKGKMIDYFSEHFDNVVRFQGGNNAGHTIYKNGQKITLHFIPSGVLNDNILNILAQGMVIEPIALLEEIDKLHAFGRKLDNLLISDKCHVIMPYHKDLDAIKEQTQKIGTTKKGIGPTYTDKVSREGIRMVDFLDEQTLSDFFDKKLPSVNALLCDHGKMPYDKAALIQQFAPIQKRLKGYVVNTRKIILTKIHNDETMLFESAQGTMLCIENGTYPYVTSSSPVSANAALGSGIPPKYINTVMGIIKAYTTRVGEGFFPTAIEDAPLQNHIREHGNEYGTTTGRARKIGWLDIVALNYAKEVNGISSFSMNHLDVLSGLDEIKLCVSYSYQGETIKDFPASTTLLKHVKPNYIVLPGFTLKKGVKYHTLNDLPKNAIQFVKNVEKLLNCPIVYTSIGPQKEDILQTREASQ